MRFRHPQVRWPDRASRIVIAPAWDAFREVVGFTYFFIARASAGRSRSVPDTLAEVRAAAEASATIRCYPFVAGYAVVSQSSHRTASRSGEALDSQLLGAYGVDDVCRPGAVYL